jgi:site-specific recombinase XerD
MEPAQILEHIDSFKAFLALERNCSKGTLVEYSSDLKAFVEYLQTQKKEKQLNDVSLISEDDLHHYIEYLFLKTKCKSVTIARKISSLRSFFTFLKERRIITRNPSLELKSPKLPKKLPIYLTENELLKLLATPDRTKEEGIRDFAILILFSYSGLRISELRGLNINSLNFEDKNVKVMGKGSKERIIPLIEPVIEAVKKYLEIRPTSDTEALFISKFKRRISIRALRNIVYKYRMLAGISVKNFSPHKLRHTFATLLHNHDVDILDIQALLGHASIATTQIYTHTNSKRLRDAVDKLDT